MRVPAGASPLVSANIPSSPEISSWLLLIVMFPAVSVLVAFDFAVALILASSPIVTVWELIVMSPALPLLSVSVVRLVRALRSNLLVWILILPASPAPVVEAVIFIPSVVVRFSVSILIVPASPAPVVPTEIFPSPVISIVSEALISIFPPLPVDVVLAEIKPLLVKLMSRSGVLL